MARVLIEQNYNPPMSDDTYGSVAAKLDTYLDLRDAIWIRSYIAADKRRAICELEAADAAMVREAYRNAGAPFTRAWRVELVEQVGSASGAIRVIIESSGDGDLSGVRGWSRSYIAADGRLRISEVGGLDATAVAHACRVAGVAVERAWVAGQVLKIEDYPEWLEKRELLRARTRR